MQTLFKAAHKINGKGRVSMGTLKQGDIDDFTIFYYWDNFVEKVLAEISKNRKSKRIEFSRGKKGYVLDAHFDDKSELNLCYEILQK